MWIKYVLIKIANAGISNLKFIITFTEYSSFIYSFFMRIVNRTLN